MQKPFKNLVLKSPSYSNLLVEDIEDLKDGFTSIPFSDELVKFITELSSYLMASDIAKKHPA